MELNDLLSKKQAMFYQKLSIINPPFVKSDSLVNQTSNLRVNFNDINDKISGFITWQDTLEGKAADLPIIEEFHKEILFTDRDI